MNQFPTQSGIYHDVKTVVLMGRGGTENGALLMRAAAEFNAFITVDANPAIGS
jgi:hypothetical protein